MRKDLDNAELSAVGADEFNALFDAAQKKALESFGGFVPEERDLPRGVKKLPSEKFVSVIGWGGKARNIGTFNTPEQASAAYMSVRKDRDDAKLSTVGADEAKAMFDAAKKKAAETVGGFALRKGDLPQGVQKLPSGKFQSKIWCGGKYRNIGTFDTPEQASAAYISVRKDLVDAKVSAISADEVDAIFDEARKKALEMVQATMNSDG